MRPGIARALWSATVATAAVLPLAVVLGSGRTLVHRDTVRLFEPLRALVTEALRQGRLPLWNPHEALGIPLFGQLMHGVLHPVSLVVALLAPQAGMDVLIVAYVALAALGAAVLARTLGCSRGAAAVAGLGYGLSGYVLGMSAILTYLAAAASAPWALSAMRAAGEGRRHGTPLAASAMAVLHLAGDPQWAMLTALLGGALAIEAGGWRGLARAAAGIAVGTAIAAIQLLPAWAYFSETTRAAGWQDFDRGQWALAPWRLVEMVAPGFFGGRPGAATAPVFLALGGPTRRVLPFAPSVFLGATLLALAVSGARASRAARVMTVAALLLLWLAMGTRLGADQALQSVPVWSALRYPEKLVGPFSLCLAALAGLGADRLASAGRPRAVALALASGSAVFLAGGLVFWLGGEDLARRVTAPQVGALVRERLATGLPRAAVGLGLLAATLGAAARPAVRRRLPAIAAALVFVESASASPYALHRGVRGVREERPLSAIQAPGSVPRIITILDVDFGYGPAELDEVDRRVAVASRMGVEPYGVPAGLDQCETYTGLYPRRLHAVADALRAALGPFQPIALRRYGVTHVVVGPTRGATRTLAQNAVREGRPVLEEPGFTVWEVPHRPWAFFAERVVSASSEREAYQRLAAAASSGGPEVVLEGPAPPRLAPGRVLWVERRPERLRIEAESPGDGLLVVNDAFWPGWKASIDGSPVPILAADGLVRAVSWPAGRHLLEMRYEPSEVRMGAMLSAIGIAALAALAWAGRRGPFPMEQKRLG